jgi:hypothetical protein
MKMEIEFGIKNVALRRGRPRNEAKNRNVPIFDNAHFIDKNG